MQSSPDLLVQNVYEPDDSDIMQSTFLINCKPSQNANDKAMDCGAINDKTENKNENVMVDGGATLGTNGNFNTTNKTNKSNIVVVNMANIDDSGFSNGNTLCATSDDQSGNYSTQKQTKKNDNVTVDCGATIGANYNGNTTNKANESTNAIVDITNIEDVDLGIGNKLEATTASQSSNDNTEKK